MPGACVVGGSCTSVVAISGRLLGVLISGKNLNLVYILVFMVCIVVVLFGYFGFASLGREVFFTLVSTVVVSLTTTAVFTSIVFFRFAPGTMVF